MISMALYRMYSETREQPETIWDTSKFIMEDMKLTVTPESLFCSDPSISWDRFTQQWQYVDCGTTERNEITIAAIPSSHHPSPACHCTENAGGDRTEEPYELHAARTWVGKDQEIQGPVAQWWSVCFPCVRFQLQSSVSPERILLVMLGSSWYSKLSI